MNNKETNRNLKDTKLVAATKKKKLKENNEIPLKLRRTAVCCSSTDGMD